MIGRIRGILIEKKPPVVLLEVAGLAYEVQASMTTFGHLPQIGQEAILHTHFVVREDAQLLYGFHETRERALFRLLIKINGVGPKMALGLLSGMDVDSFLHCVSLEDSAALVRVPGVGKKTAERLIVEMRDKLSAFELGATTSVSEPLAQQPLEQVKQDAISALVALGYKLAEATKAVNNVYESHLNSEQLIRHALQGAMSV